MINVNCAVCGNVTSTNLFNRKDRFGQEIFSYVQCNFCGHIYLNPRPSGTEIQQYYPVDYEAYSSSGNRKPIDVFHHNRSLLRQFHYMNSFFKVPGNLLDVGCATGDYLAVAHQHGWEVMGLDLVDTAVKLARTKYRLKVITGEVFDVAPDEYKFDAITLWDVLEHLENPELALIHCYRLLRFDGVIVFSIPNLDSVDRYLFGKNWVGWDAPRHFHLFDHSHILSLLNRTGFTLVGKRCITGGKGSLFLSLDTVFGNDSTYKFIKKIYPIIGYSLWPYRQISYAISRGPVITYVARKAKS